MDFSGGPGEIARADLALAATRTRRRLIAACIGIVAVTQVAVGTLFATTDRRRFGAVLVVEAVTIATVGVMVLVVRRSKLGLGIPSVLLGVDRATRRTVSRAIQRGEAVEDPRLARLAVDAAEQMQRRRWLIWLWIIAAALQVPGLLERRTTLGRALGIAVAVIFAGNAVLWWWLTHRASRAKTANAALASSHTPTDRSSSTT